MDACARLATDVHQTKPERPNNHLTVYVDDFIMAGPDHHLEWDAIRSKIKITDPTPVDRVLGVHHTFKKVDKTKSEVVLDMKAYTDQALNMYHAVPNAPPLNQMFNTLGMNRPL